MTRVHQEMLKVFAEKIRDKLEEGLTIRVDTSFESAVLTAQLVGSIAVVRQLQSLEYETLVNELEE